MTATCCSTRCSTTTRNLDVFHAAANAGEHYAVFGWHEGRDPNAFLSTTSISPPTATFHGRTVNPTCPNRLRPGSAACIPAPGAGGGRAAGAARRLWIPAALRVCRHSSNPLEHYRDTGWREGHDPSLLFDTTLYLIHNPDVAAAGVNPLEHFLQYGRAEGRAAYPSIGQNIGMWGFDAEFYLMSNPDVAAAGFDPLEHYKSSGGTRGAIPTATSIRRAISRTTPTSRRPASIPCSTMTSSAGARDVIRPGRSTRSIIFRQTRMSRRRASIR